MGAQAVLRDVLTRGEVGWWEPTQWIKCWQAGRQAAVGRQAVRMGQTSHGASLARLCRAPRLWCGAACFWAACCCAPACPPIPSIRCPTAPSPTPHRPVRPPRRAAPPLPAAAAAASPRWLIWCWRATRRMLSLRWASAALPRWWPAAARTPRWVGQGAGERGGRWLGTWACLSGPPRLDDEGPGAGADSGETLEEGGACSSSCIAPPPAQWLPLPVAMRLICTAAASRLPHRRRCRRHSSL